jgi:DNA repair protein RadC
MYEDREVVLLLSLDANKCVRSCNEMGIGVINAVDINVRKIAETAMKNKACSVILAHNHPDGNTDPSPQDIETTRRIREALCLIDIPLVDHLIVSEQKYSSLCDLGLL